MSIMDKGITKAFQTHELADKIKAAGVQFRRELLAETGTTRNARAERLADEWVEYVTGCLYANGTDETVEEDAMFDTCREAAGSMTQLLYVEIAEDFHGLRAWELDCDDYDLSWSEFSNLSDYMEAMLCAVYTAVGTRVVSTIYAD